MSDTHDDSEARRLHPPGTLVQHLMVSLECDRPLAGSARFGLDGIEQIEIGRGEARSATRRAHLAPTLEVRIPGRSMSTTHARLVRVGYSWAIEDLGSKNGIFVDGTRTARAVLGPESVFEIGHTFMRIGDLSLPDGAAQDFDASGTRDGYATVDALFASDLERVSRLVASGVPALLIGESGTGKEVLARRLHARAGGGRGDFVAVNCGAIPASLVESQLFGHVKGAFSGAARDETGFVRAAHGGTLFLDEIADLPKASQAALLRVLQEREVVPVGATRPIAVDVRVLAATHQPLDRLIERGDFRQDLYARVAGCVLELPLLRERRDDLGILIAALLSKNGSEVARAVTFTPDAGLALLTYDWPMNVRELEQCVSTCVALAPSGRIDASHLPPNVAAALRSERPMSKRRSSATLNDRDEGLRLDLLGHLSRFHGNVTDVARAMGKPRTQIHRWCKRFSVNPNAFRN